MIGVPPICQSADGNGGESNGAGARRRCCGEAFDAGAWYAGDFKSLANASNNHLPNQSVFSATIAVGIKTPAKTPTLIKFKYSSTQTKRHSRDEALHSARSRFHNFLCLLMMLTRLAVGLEPLNAPDGARRSPPIRSALALGIRSPRWSGHSPIHLAKQRTLQCA